MCDPRDHSISYQERKTLAVPHPGTVLPICGKQARPTMHTEYGVRYDTDDDHGGPLE